jgi:hypothetical protein
MRFLDDTVFYSARKHVGNEKTGMPPSDQSVMRSWMSPAGLAEIREVADRGPPRILHWYGLHQQH